MRDRAEHGVEGVDKLVIERNIVLNEEDIVGIHCKKSLFIFLLCESTLDISMIHRIFRSVEWNVLSEGGHVTEGILHHLEHVYEGGGPIRYHHIGRARGRYRAEPVVRRTIDIRIEYLSPSFEYKRHTEGIRQVLDILRTLDKKRRQRSQRQGHREVGEVFV